MWVISPHSSTRSLDTGWNKGDYFAKEPQILPHGLLSSAFSHPAELLSLKGSGKEGTERDLGGPWATDREFCSYFPGCLKSQGGERV